MLASSWRAPAAGSRLLSLSICASVSSIAAGAGDRGDVVAAGEDPRERGLRGGCADLCADRADLVDEGEVAAEVVPGEAGVGLAPVVVGEVVDGADLSRE